MNTIARNALRVGAVILGLSLLLGGLEAAQVYIGVNARGRAIGWSEAIASTLPSWLILALLTPLIRLLTERMPLDRWQLARALPVHAFGAVAFTIVHLAGTAAAGELRTGGSLGFTERFSRLATAYFVLDLLTYAAIVGVLQMVRVSQRERARELASSRVVAQLAEARFQALRGQLDPHSLFNALNAISGLVMRGERGAVVDAIAALAHSLRASIAQDQQPLRTLAEETGDLDGTMGIYALRFPDRLAFTVQLDAGTEAALVPPLVVPQLLEHAVVRALDQPRRQHLRLRARRSRDVLMVRVEARDGPGAPTVLTALRLPFRAAPPARAVKQPWIA